MSVRPLPLLLLACATALSAQPAFSPRVFDPADADDPQPVPGMVSNSVTQLEIGYQGPAAVICGSNSYGGLRSADRGVTFSTCGSCSLRSTCAATTRHSRPSSASGSCALA